MVTYTILIFSTLFALASGALLGRRYSTFVLIPASFFVLVAMAAAVLVFNASFWWSLLSGALGLFGLHFGYLLGLAGPHFIRRPYDVSSNGLESALPGGPIGGPVSQDLSGVFRPSQPLTRVQCSDPSSIDA